MLTSGRSRRSAGRGRRSRRPGRVAVARKGRKRPRRARRPGKDWFWGEGGEVSVAVVT